MTLSTLLIVVLVLLLIGAIPAWPHARAWGPYPSSIISTILVIVVILVLLGVVG
jgi:hypothetical protein